MDMLVQENPKLVSKMVIGQSYEGRELNVLKVNHFHYMIKEILVKYLAGTPSVVFLPTSTSNT